MPIFGRSKSSPDWSDLGRVCVDLLESLPRENENEHLREIFQTIRELKLYHTSRDANCFFYIQEFFLLSFSIYSCLERVLVFAKNFNFIFPISLQPNVMYLRYFC